MATLTVTEVLHKHPRARTLSLTRVSNSLLISRLPIELFLLILEHTILQCKPRDLALVSKFFHHALDVILYRTVVFDSPSTLQLFHRTTQSKKSSFFADHVMIIAVTGNNIASHPHFHNIIALCSGARSLIMPSTTYYPETFLKRCHAIEDGLFSITFKSFEGRNIVDTSAHQLATDTLTHLRICEPSDVWCSPTTMVGALGRLPNLSHLQLARRANANQANDKMFILSISKLLRYRPSLKMLVVSIFPEAFSTSKQSVQKSDIWYQMCQLRRSDQRLIVIPGYYDEWKDGWNEQRALRSGWLPRNFWLYARDISDT